MEGPTSCSTARSRGGLEHMSPISLSDGATRHWSTQLRRPPNAPLVHDAFSNLIRCPMGIGLALFDARIWPLRKMKWDLRQEDAPSVSIGLAQSRNVSRSKEVIIMTLMKTALLAMVVAGCGAPALAQAQETCTQQDIKLKYTEIGQLIRAELAGNLSAASQMMDQMHAIQDQMTSGEINTAQFCREYDSLIQEMRYHGGH